MSIKTEALVAGIIKQLEDHEQTLAELVVDAQDKAEEEGIFSAGFFTGDNDDIPICVPEDADPLLDGARTGVQEALDDLREWQKEHPWKPTDDIEQAVKPTPCPHCEGTGLDKLEKWPDGSTPSCEHCEGYGDTIPADATLARKPINKKETIGHYELEFNGDYDGDDWVTSCFILRRKDHQTYSSSLGVLEDFGTLESDRGEFIHVSKIMIEKIRRWAEKLGY